MLLGCKKYLQQRLSKTYSITLIIRITTPSCGCLYLSTEFFPGLPLFKFYLLKIYQSADSNEKCMEVTQKYSSRLLGAIYRNCDLFDRELSINKYVKNRMRHNLFLLEKIKKEKYNI